MIVEHSLALGYKYGMFQIAAQVRCGATVMGPEGMQSAPGGQRRSVSGKGGKACAQTAALETYTSRVLERLDFSKRKHLNPI